MSDENPFLGTRLDARYFQISRRLIEWFWLHKKRRSHPISDRSVQQVALNLRPRDLPFAMEHQWESAINITQKQLERLVETTVLIIQDR